MRKVRLLIMVALIVGAFSTSFTPLRATGGGWTETDYYDDAGWTNLVGGRRVDGYNPANNFNWGVTSVYKEVSGDTCDGSGYYCTACWYIDNQWTCWYACYP